jgi:hypothetical protein
LDVPKGNEVKITVRRHVIIDGPLATAVRADGPRVLAGDDLDWPRNFLFVKSSD